MPRWLMMLLFVLLFVGGYGGAHYYVYRRMLLIFGLAARPRIQMALRLALFFLAMAVLNEIIWRTQTTDFWVSFKLFGAIPLTMVFAMSQMPLMKRYHLEPASLEASEAEAGDVSKG